MDTEEKCIIHFKQYDPEVDFSDNHYPPPPYMHLSALNYYMYRLGISFKMSGNSVGLSRKLRLKAENSRKSQKKTRYLRTFSPISFERLKI